MKINKIILPALALALTASTALSQARLTKFREIYHDEAKYIKRSSNAWRDGGRIIGEIKNTPNTFSISIKQGTSGKTLYTYKHPARLLIYQTQKIPPGTYNLTIESEGFQPRTIKNIKVMARSDCLINLNFGTRVYDNR